MMKRFFLLSALVLFFLTALGAQTSGETNALVPLPSGYRDMIRMANLVPLSSEGYLLSHKKDAYAQTFKGGGFPCLVSPFSMGKYEVTYELWYAVRVWGEAHGYAFSGLGREGNFGKNGEAPTKAEGVQPVTYVTWRDAVLWCNAYSEASGLRPAYFADSGFASPIRTAGVAAEGLAVEPGAMDNPFVDWKSSGYRLPTESEWQFAASCGGLYRFDYASGAKGPVKDRLKTNYVSWSMNNSQFHSWPVATREPNAFGMYDLSGNAHEWCWDWKGDLPSGTRTDYRGPAAGQTRVFRGGAWASIDLTHGVGNRFDSSPNFFNDATGLRVVQSGD